MKGYAGFIVPNFYKGKGYVIVLILQYMLQCHYLSWNILSDSVIRVLKNTHGSHAYCLCKRYTDKPTLTQHRNVVSPKYFGYFKEIFS